MGDIASLPRVGIDNMTVAIFGRLGAARQRDATFYTSVTAPAVDHFSKPAVVEVRSKRPLGVVGQEVTLNCVLGGYARRVEGTNKRTGEVFDYYTADHTLSLVE